MNEILKDFLIYGSYAIGSGISYMGLLCAGNVLEDIGEEKIETQEKLEQITNEEARNLGIIDKIIETEFVSDRGAGIRKSGLGYKLEIKKGDTRGRVRHELFHAKFCHFDTYPPFKYLLWNEPQAIICNLAYKVRKKNKK